MDRVFSATISALAFLSAAARRGYRKAPREMKRWGKCFGRQALLTLLITQLLLPAPFAYAPDPPQPPDQNNQQPIPRGEEPPQPPPEGVDLGASGAVAFDPTSLETFRGMGIIPDEVGDDEVNPAALEHAAAMVTGIARAGQESSRLNISAVRRNMALLLDQHLIDTQTGQEYDLTITNLRRPNVGVAPGVVERALHVEPTANGVLLSVAENRYQHRIRFKAGVELLDYDWDNARVHLLASDGTRHVIEVSALGPTRESQGLLYNASIPVLYLGKAQTVAGQPANRIRIIQRRVDPVDRSRAAQEARLDRNARHRRRLEWISNGNLVTRLEENLEMVRPIPLHPELERQLKAQSPDGKVWHDSGDVAICYADGDKEQIVGKESAVANDALIGLQMGPLFALWTLASPDSAQAVRDLRDARGSGQEAVAEVLNDPGAFEEFYVGGVQRALSRIPAPALNNMNASVQRTIARVASANRQGTPGAIRDRFTQEDWEEDYRYFQDLVATARETNRRREGRGYLNPLRYNTVNRLTEWGSRQVDKLSNFDLPKRMRQACTVLKWPAIVAGGALAIAAAGAGADYMLNHGNNVALAADTLAETWNHTVNYTVPVLQNPSYTWDMMRYSMTARMAILLSVFAIAWLARPFCQHGVNKLITITGIKYLFSITIIPPQRLLAILTGRSRLIDAMKNGYTPWRFLMPLGAVRSASIDTVSAQIDESNRLRSLSTALAIHAVAQAEGIDPLLLMQQMVATEDAEAGAPDPKVRVERTRAVAIALTDCFLNGNGRNIAKALQDHPEEFAATLDRARAVAAGMVGVQGDNTRPATLPFLRCVVARNFAMGVGWFGEAKWRNLLNPQPPQDFADYVARSYLIDGILTFVVSSFSGRFADPSRPDLLAYQPGIPGFNTHEYLVLNDFEQTALHLGASAANDYLSAGYEGQAAFSAYRPAGLMDEDRTVASRSFWRDSWSILGLLLNVRRNNYLVGFGIRSWTQCVTLLQGFFVIGMVLRLFEGVVQGEELATIFTADAFVHATVGQTYFIYIAPFVYRWFWAVALTTTRSLQAQINQLAGDFPDHFAQLQVAVRNGDEKKAKAEAIHMIELYAQRVRGVPKEILDSIKTRDDEDALVWAARVLEACRTAPPVPEVTNELANKGIVYVGGVVTTILAMKLMVDSFDKRPFWGKDNPPDSWGFDTSDWNMWDGVSPHDSVPALMAKSLLNVTAIWGLGHVINIGVDATKLALAARWVASAQNADNPVELREATAARDSALGAFSSSVDGLLTMPGLGMLAPPPPSVTTGAARLEHKCGDAVAEQDRRMGPAAAP